MLLHVYSCSLSSPCPLTYHTSPNYFHPNAVLTFLFKSSCYRGSINFVTLYHVFVTFSPNGFLVSLSFSFLGCCCEINLSRIFAAFNMSCSTLSPPFSPNIIPHKAVLFFSCLLGFKNKSLFKKKWETQESMEYIKIGFSHHLGISAIKVLVPPFLFSFFFKCVFWAVATHSRQRGYFSEYSMLSWVLYSGSNSYHLFLYWDIIDI